MRILLALLLLLPTLAHAQLRMGKRDRFVPGEVIVKYKESASGSVRLQALKSHSAVKIGQPAKHFEQVRIREGQSVAEAMSELSRDPGIESVQPNFIYRTFALPNDPQLGQQWGLKNTGQTITLAAGKTSTNNPGTAGADISAEAAWSIRTDCSAVVIAIIDSGINYRHEDLAGNMWDGGAAYPNHGYDFPNNDNDPSDLLGHGTHVAGTIGAIGNNGTGVAGVCWKAKLMAVKVSESGSATSADMAKGFDFAIANGAKVINLSMGNTENDPMMKAAVQKASDAGIVIIAAAGNDASDNDQAPTYPCSYKLANVLCVAAVDQKSQLASFSNFGKTTVHVAAPGANIRNSFAGTVKAGLLPFGAGSPFVWQGSGWSTSQITVQTDTGAKNVEVFSATPGYDGNKNYANNVEARTYTSVSLAGYDSALLTIVGMFDLALGDSISFGYKAAGGDPFAGGGTVFTDSNFQTDRESIVRDFSLNACRTSTCSFGLRFRSDAAQTNYGVAILAFALEALTVNTNSYEIQSGTSMAAPHVTGLAALILSQNPAYKAGDVITAIKEGGRAETSLAGKISTGKAVDAASSLKFIGAPKGVSVSVGN